MTKDFISWYSTNTNQTNSRIDYLTSFHDIVHITKELFTVKNVKKTTWIDCSKTLNNSWLRFLCETCASCSCSSSSNRFSLHNYQKNIKKNHSWSFQSTTCSNFWIMFLAQNQHKQIYAGYGVFHRSTVRNVVLFFVSQMQSLSFK